MIPIRSADGSSEWDDECACAYSPPTSTSDDSTLSPTSYTFTLPTSCIDPAFTREQIAELHLMLSNPRSLRTLHSTLDEAILYTLVRLLNTHRTNRVRREARHRQATAVVVSFAERKHNLRTAHDLPTTTDHLTSVRNL